MNNGQGTNQLDPTRLAVIQNPIVMSPEEYRRRMTEVQRVMDRLASYRRDLDTGYQRYVAQEQELMQRVEAGRQAQRMLLELQAAGRTLGQSSLPAPAAAPSLNVSSSNYLPTTAQPIHAVTEQPVSPSLPQTQNMPRQQQTFPTGPSVFDESAPRQSYNQNEVLSQTWRQHGYKLNAQVQTAFGTQHHDGLHSQVFGVTSSSVDGQNSYSAQGPVLSGPNNGSSHNLDSLPTIQKPPFQAASSSASSLYGALGSTEGNSSGVTHAKTMYTSKHKKTSSDSVESASNTADICSSIFSLLKSLQPHIVDYIFFSVLHALQKKFNSGFAPNEGWLKAQDQLPDATKEQLKIISASVTRQLYDLDASAIKQVILRVRENLHAQYPHRPNIQPQQMSSAKTAVASDGVASIATHGIQSHAPAKPPSAASVNIYPENLPPSSTSRPVLQTQPHSSPLASTIHTPIPFSSSTPSISPLSPSGRPTDGGDSRSQRTGHGKEEIPVPTNDVVESGQFVYAQPRTGIDPKLSRSALGSTQLQNDMGKSQAPLLLPRHSQASTSLTAAATPAPLAANDAGKTPPPLGRRGPWTPAKADKARLAHDIMRSLGRPGRPSPGRPIATTPPMDTPTIAKRKREVSLSASPSELKKQRTEANDVEEIATAGALELAVWQRVNEENGQTVAVQEDGPRAVPELGHHEDIHQADRPASAVMTAPDDGVHATASAPVDDSLAAAAVILLPESSIHVPSVDPAPLLSALQRTTPRQTPQEERTNGSISEVPIVPETTSPRNPESVASGPPTSRSVSPLHTDTGELQFAEHLQSADEPLQEVSKASLSLDIVHASEDNQPGPSITKTPLFLPSPSSSHEEEPEDVPEMDLDRSGNDSDEDMQMSGFVMNTGLLGSKRAVNATPRLSKKSKGRAVLSDDDDDDEVDIIANPQRSLFQESSKIERTVKSSTGGNRKDFFVLVPAAPQWVKQIKAREDKEREQRWSPIEIYEVDEDDELDEERKKEELLQREAVRLSYTRLRELPCQWRGCYAVLNSNEMLMKHAARHAAEKETGPYGCDWHGCGRKFNIRSALQRHLLRHASHPIFCAFQDCDRSFASSKELYQHHNSYRHRGQPLKRTPEPFLPADAKSLPPLPATLPAYMAIPRRVTQHAISKDVHNWLGARVLENLASFNFPGRRSQVSAPSRNSRRLAERVAAIEEEGHDPQSRLELIRRITQDEYDSIVQGRPLKASKRCDDIPSSEVTRMCEDGLVLFPPPGEETDDMESVEAKNEPDELDFLHDFDASVPASEEPSGAEQAMQDVDDSGQLAGGSGVNRGAIDVAEDSTVVAGDRASSHQSGDEPHQSEVGWTFLPMDKEEEAVESLL